MKANPNPFGRSIRYVVLPVEAVRTLNVRSDDQVIEAQSCINEDMILSLENMVKAARANQLDGRTALLQEAAAW